MELFYDAARRTLTLKSPMKIGVGSRTRTEKLSMAFQGALLKRFLEALANLAMGSKTSSFFHSDSRAPVIPIRENEDGSISGSYSLGSMTVSFTLPSAQECIMAAKKVMETHFPLKEAHYTPAKSASKPKAAETKAVETKTVEPKDTEAKVAETEDPVEEKATKQKRRTSAKGKRSTAKKEEA